MKKYSLVLLVGAAVVIGFLMGTRWSDTHERPRSREQEIKLGGLFALSGFAGFAGEASRDGFIMAVEDSGLDIQYVIEDFQSDHTKVANAATKLATVDKVSVVIGPEWTEFGTVVSPIADESKVVFVSPWMNFEGSLLDSPYYFSATPSERHETRRLVEYIASQQHRRISLVASKGVWAEGYVEVLKDELQAYPNLNIIQELNVSPDVHDFRTEIAKINEAQPDAIYTVITTDNAQGTFSKQLKEFGVETQVYFPFSRGGSSVLQKEFGPFVDGAIFPAPKAYKNAEAFNAKYEQRFGKKPGAISAATAYDITTLVLKAIKEGASNSEEIREYLENVKAYDGYSNLIEFDERGQVKNEEVELRQIRNGEAVTL